MLVLWPATLLLILLGTAFLLGRAILCESKPKKTGAYALVFTVVAVLTSNLGTYTYLRLEHHVDLTMALFVIRELSEIESNNDFQEIRPHLQEFAASADPSKKAFRSKMHHLLTELDTEYSQ